MIPQVPTLRVLRGARKLVANPSTWFAGHFSNGSGHSPWDTDATCFCLEGAIYRSGAEHGLPGSFWRTGDLWDSLMNAMGAIALRMFDLPDEGRPLPYVNDTMGRNAALKLLDATIAELVEAGAPE